MNEETWQTLYDKYPILFENRHKSSRESCMSFGVECNAGWHQILSSLCFQINQHEKNVKARLKYEGKDISLYEPVKFDQVKSKFGSLRVYFSGGDEYVRGLVSMAEAISYHTCEVCGNKGEANKKGWIKVLCKGCENNEKTS